MTPHRRPTDDPTPDSGDPVIHLDDSLALAVAQRHTARARGDTATEGRLTTWINHRLEQRLALHTSYQPPAHPESPATAPVRHRTGVAVPAVTRAELTEHVATAFDTGPATRADLLAAATASHARPTVIDVLHRLPDTAYRSIRDLWYHLADLPVDN